MNQLANKVSLNFWWPALEKDADRFVDTCEDCKKTRGIPTDETLNWPAADKWERLHMDWAYGVNFGNLLAIVDTGTNFIDPIMCKNRDYLHYWAFHVAQYQTTHLNSSHNECGWRTYHPSSNGAAERQKDACKQSKGR